MKHLYPVLVQLESQNTLPLLVTNSIFLHKIFVNIFQADIVQVLVQMEKSTLSDHDPRFRKDQGQSYVRLALFQDL